LISQEMRRTGKHMDNVFREGLSDLNVTPPADAWKVIENRISRRKTRPLFVVRLAAASLLLFVLTGSLWLFFLRKPADKGLTDQPVFSSPQSGTTVVTKQSQQQNPVINQKHAYSYSGVKRSTTLASPSEVKKSITPVTKQKHIASVETPVSNLQPSEASAGLIKTENEISSERRQNAIVPVTKMPVSTKFTLLLRKAPSVLSATRIHAALALRANEAQQGLLPVSPVIQPKEKNKGVWGLGGDFGPVYAYRNLASDNILLSRYLNGQESGIVSFGGNLSVSFKKGKRVSFQSGLSYYRLGQVSQDIIAFRSIKSGSLAFLETKGNEFIHVSEGQLGYDRNPLFVANRKNPGGYDQIDFLLTRLGTGIYEPVDVLLKQNLEFIEVPLLIRYSLVDKTFGVNLIGGMGTSILLKGQATVISDDGQTVLGNLYDIRRANLNGTLGVGMSYHISSNFLLRLEPTFKYYLNPVNIDAEIAAHPYSIGIFSGISIIF